MRHPQLFQPTRRGFTLVEVALAVAVGLIVIAGAVLGYQVTKDSAASSNARERVNLASGIVAEYSAANYGNFPPSNPAVGGGAFSKMWALKNPQTYNVSPWGGQTGTPSGVTELAPISNGTTDPLTAPDDTNLLTTDQTHAANLIYVTTQNNTIVKIQQLSNPTAYVTKGFVIGIYDRAGQPWFHLATNK